MSGLVKGIGIIFAGAVVLYVVRFLMPYLITGTSAGENIFAYLVPLAIFMAIPVTVFMLWFRRKPKV